MNLNQFLSHTEDKRMNEDYFSDAVAARSDSSLRQLPHLSSSASYSKGHNQEYTEIDLLSECSSPVSYVPGRYLQLCDMGSETEDHAKIWPVSKRSALPDVDVVSPGSNHSYNQGYPQNQSIWKSSRQNLASTRLVATIAVCIIIALSALGGLAAFV